MYKSPIDIEYEYPDTSFIRAVNKQIDEKTIEAVVNVGITVDKDRLIKALAYDREQYDKGYDDGFNDGRKALAAELVDLFKENGDWDEVTE